MPLQNTVCVGQLCSAYAYTICNTVTIINGIWVPAINYAIGVCVCVQAGNRYQCGMSPNWLLVGGNGQLKWFVSSIRDTCAFKSIEETRYDERIVQLALIYGKQMDRTPLSIDIQHISIGLLWISSTWFYNVNKTQTSILMNFAQIHTSIKPHWDTIKLTTWFMFWLKFHSHQTLKSTGYFQLSRASVQVESTLRFEFLAICSFGFLFV